MAVPFPERSSYPPIADYALLSDCEVGALVAASGNIEWLCLPRFDSPSVFGSVLDRDAGRFRFGPAEVEVPAARRYLPGSLVLETTWKARTGWLVVRDALTVGPWHHVGERAHRQHRPPRDWEAEHALVRVARCVQGTVELHVECEPAFEYGTCECEWEYVGPTYHEARGFSDGASVDVTLMTDLRLGFEGNRAAARTTLREGDVAFVALAWSEHPAPKTVHEATERMTRTSEYWREWLSQGHFPDHPWRAYLERSALTLKGLSYAPTGAIVSAPTTSLPRVPGGTRNYDYRYSFMRDAALALRGAYGVGFDWEADDFFYFLGELGGDGPIQNIYAVDGRRDLRERTLDHLEGYEGARPVRIGNDAADYQQHDVWGALVLAADLYARSGDRLPERIWPAIKDIVELAIEHWREPDQGIWASRAEPRHYTSSKVMCWVAADRGAKLASERGDYELQDRWRAAAGEIQQDVIDHGLGARGVFTAYYGTDELDASVLLIPLSGFLAASDHRVRDTVMAINDELTYHGMVIRHRPHHEGEDVGGETFVVCSLWLVSALAMIGEFDRARMLCERVLAWASPLGLFAEHIDPRNGRHMGNYPHAFTHLELVNAILTVLGERGRYFLAGS